MESWQVIAGDGGERRRPRTRRAVQRSQEGPRGEEGSKELLLPYETLREVHGKSIPAEAFLWPSLSAGRQGSSKAVCTMPPPLPGVPDPHPSEGHASSCEPRVGLAPGVG